MKLLREKKDFGIERKEQLHAAGIKVKNIYEKLGCGFLMPLCELYVTTELGVQIYVVRKKKILESSDKNSCMLQVSR